MKALGARIRRECFEQGTWVGVLVMLLMLAAIGLACFAVGRAWGFERGYETAVDSMELTIEGEPTPAPLPAEPWPPGGWG